MSEAAIRIGELITINEALQARLAEAERLLRELRDRCETNGMGMIGIGHRIQVALGERAADVSEEQR
jgi:translation initiation factor 1 (eIF-1/SUI1)